MRIKNFNHCRQTSNGKNRNCHPRIVDSGIMGASSKWFLFLELGHHTYWSRKLTRGLACGNSDRQCRCCCCLSACLAAVLEFLWSDESKRKIGRGHLPMFDYSISSNCISFASGNDVALVMKEKDIAFQFLVTFEMCHFLYSD